MGLYISSVFKHTVTLYQDINIIKLFWILTLDESLTTRPGYRCNTKIGINIDTEIVINIDTEICINISTKIGIDIDTKIGINIGIGLESKSIPTLVLNIDSKIDINIDTEIGIDIDANVGICIYTKGINSDSKISWLDLCTTLGCS